MTYLDREALATTGVEFHGVLIADGRCASKVLDGQGHTVPVLILEVASECGMHMPAHFEQAFPVGRMDQAEAAARRFRKGQRVAVQASALSVRLSAVATHIRAIPEYETTQP